ncbi:MAG: vitamin B12 dependent-methionine synthase activation domain-containing protein [Desulfobacterales bacterium]
MRKQLDKVERVFPYVVSIGNQLEDQIRNCSDLLDQYYLDTIGNVALSTVRKYFERTLMSKYALEGCLSSMSPGPLSDWPIEEQKPLFSILGDEETSVGVRITEHLLMVPTKSISGIYFPTEIPFVCCQLCPRQRCASRKADFDEKLARENNISIHQDIH